VICPSGQGQPCPHGETGCFPACRFDTDDLGNAYDHAAARFWKSDLPKLCDFGQKPAAIAWYRRVPFKAFLVAGLICGFGYGLGRLLNLF
jgi:hypothetical protein